MSETSVIKSDVDEAYERGKREASEDFHRQLALVANQVYDNVQEQLDAIEKVQVESAKKTVCVIYI